MKPNRPDTRQPNWLPSLICPKKQTGMEMEKKKVDVVASVNEEDVVDLVMKEEVKRVDGYPSTMQNNEGRRIDKKNLVI